MAKHRTPKKGSKDSPKVIRARRRGENDGDEDMEAMHTQSWWCMENGSDAASSAWAWCDQMRSFHSVDAMMDLVHEAIYRGRPVGSSAQHVGRQYLLLRSGALLNLNVVMSLVDTATARLTKRRPMPKISADDANYSQRRFAERCSRVLRRKIGGTQLSAQSPLVIRDMVIRGDGAFKAETFDGDVHNKRIPIYELVYDPFEAEHGGPRTLAHVRPEPRDVMCARYPMFHDQIMDAPSYQRNEPWATWAYPIQSASNYIEVRELWHLPSGHEAHDGVHIVTLKGVTILRERWRWDGFPIVQTQWSPPTRGYRGAGLVETLAGIQEQVNDILKDAREGLKHGSQLTIFAQRGSNVNKHHLRKRHPAVVEYDGVEPHYVAPNPVSEQAIRMLLLLLEQAQMISGMSQWSTSGQNPLGASASGKALETIDDQQSDRFAHVEASWQNARVRLGEVNTWLAKDLYESVHGKPDEDDKVYPETPTPPEEDDLAAWIAGTDWSKLDLDCGDYHIVLEPVNYLESSREGRLSQVAELGKNGMIPDPSIQADLFDEPDLQAANRIILGPKHQLDSIMEGLADVAVPMFDLQPDQYMNLPLGVLMAKGELAEAQAARKFDREDPELEQVCERYREWIELAKDQLSKSAADAAPSLPGMMPTSMGAAPNAATLQPGLGGPAPAPAPGPAGPMPPMPAA